jgi:hypothetical protein
MRLDNSLGNFVVALQRSVPKSPCYQEIIYGP